MIPYALALAGEGWLSTAPVQGVVPAGGSVEVTATFNAARLFGGDYHADVVVESNDPDESTVRVPAHLHVTGAPDLGVSRDSIDFGELVVGHSRQDSLLVSNLGTDVLLVSSVEVVNPVFTAPGTGFSLAVGESRMLHVGFAPTGAGPFAGSLVLHSNDPGEAALAIPLHGTAVLPPDVVVSPPIFQEVMSVDEVRSEELALENRGGTPLNWSVDVTFEPLSAVTEHIAARPSSGAPTPEPEVVPAPGATPDRTRLISSKSRVGAGSTRQARPTGSSATLGGGSPPPLAEVLALLDEHFTRVTDSIPGRFDFEEGESGTFILDGGGDMYNLGNYLETDLSGFVPYSNLAISSDPAFGNPTGAYFTAKYPGLFVLAADIQNVEYLAISGNLGAHGRGSVDGAELEVTRGGTLYRGFVKRVFGTAKPSVNHLIIVPEPGETYHEFSDYTGDDWDVVGGLGTSQRIYYLLYAGSSGRYIDDDKTLAIMRAFIAAVTPPPPPWLSVTPDSGVVPPHATARLAVTFDSRGRAAGQYDAHLFVHSDDPAEPLVTVPASMLVGGGPVAIEVSLVSSTAEPGLARLVWYAAKTSALSGTVYRRTEDGDWAALGAVSPDGEGYLRFEDHEVAAGQRYGYRLGIVEDGKERFVGEVWVEVPQAVTFALHGLKTNPAVRDVVVVFSLPDALPAALDLIDVGGRRVATQEVGSLGPGRHSVTLGAGRALPPGVYLVRLSRAGQALTVRAAVIR